MAAGPLHRSAGDAARSALPRVVAPETLDNLPEDDPAAMRSRRDLRRVHLAMGTRGILLRAWRALPPPAAGLPPRVPRVLELGAGDGTLLLGVARARLPAWTAVDLTLLDRQTLLAADTLQAYAAAGWSARALRADVLDWAEAPGPAASQGAGSVPSALTAAPAPSVALTRETPATLSAPAERLAAGAPVPPAAAGRWDLIVANLFLHHFQPAELAMLLRAVASRCNRFLACEPRRSRLALAGSHLVGAIGANAVTREDAVLSVHAGFRGDELSRLWPGGAEAGNASSAGSAGDSGPWALQEVPAGLFTHRFSAVRTACR